MPPQPKNYNKLGFLVLGLLISVFFSAKFFPSSVNVSTSSLLGSSVFSFNFKNSSLSTVIAEVLDEKQGSYAIFVEDLTGGEKYTLNPAESFPAASLYKLYLIATVMQEIDNGRLSLDSKITAKKENLIERFESVDSGYDEAPEEITYTIQEALIRVGRISDNFASIMLADKVGWKKLQQMADDLGSDSTVIDGDLTTTAADTANFFKKLHKKEIVSPAVSDQVSQFLSLSQLNNRIPAQLPQEVRIVHKTGELTGVRHDAGVVYLTYRTYIIVILSKDLKYEDEGVETLAQISKEVYEYFSKKDKFH